jgi:hypothetical protein
MSLDVFLGRMEALLLLAWMSMELGALLVSSRRIRVGVWLFALLLGTLNFGSNIDAASWLFGALGRLSAPTLLLCLYGPFLLLADEDWGQTKPGRSFFWGILICAAALYPSALGAVQMDVYSWGYAAWPVVGVAIWALVLLKLGDWVGWSLLCFSLVWYASGLSGSANYWDSLIDPVLTIYSLRLMSSWIRAKAP